jgi:hypothetical protein
VFSHSGVVSSCVCHCNNFPAYSNIVGKGLILTRLELINVSNKLVFASGRLFQPSLMFVSKNRAYVSETPFKCYSLGYALGLNLKHLARKAVKEQIL